MTHESLVVGALDFQKEVFEKTFGAGRTVLRRSEIRRYTLQLEDLDGNHPGRRRLREKAGLEQVSFEGANRPGVK